MSSVILYLEVRESHLLYIYICIFCQHQRQFSVISSTNLFLWGGVPDPSMGDTVSVLFVGHLTPLQGIQSVYSFVI